MIETLSTTIRFRPDSLRLTSRTSATTFSHKLIVGQFGSGEILAFDSITGRFEGKLEDQNNAVISINGLWALAFGDGIANSDPPGQPANAMFFTAGPNLGHDGLFGTLTPVAADLTQGSDQ